MTSERDAHPDEGTIHAWLDRQLDDATAATLEAHLQRCDECAERVAEARGLIAGASRVVASLDDDADAAADEKAVARPWGPAILPTPPARRPRTFRFTPARSAIAAVLVVAVATAIVHENQQPSSRLASVAAESAAAVASGVAPMATAPSAPPAAPTPLASAPAGAAATGPVPRGRRLDSTAAERVATARAFAKAQRETTVNADLARVGRVPAPKASAPLEQTVAAANAADAAVAQRAASRVASTETRGVTGGETRGVAGGVSKGVATAPAAAAIEAPLCYRVESASGAAASWGPVPLPFTLALDAPATGASARVLTPDGREADAHARFERRGDDSLLFTLQRIGYSGTLAVGAPGEIRAGVMRSSPAMMALSEVVVTAAPPASEPRRALRKASPAAPPRADSAPAAPERDATPAVPVVVRKVGCGGRGG
jgi:hypothetical protein